MNQNLAEDVAVRLRAARVRRGLSGREVGQQLGGLTPAQISKMETGQQRIPLDLLPAWCEAVEITLEEVFGLEYAHQFGQIPVSPRIAKMYGQLPLEWRLPVQRLVESLYQLYRKR